MKAFEQITFTKEEVLQGLECCMHGSCNECPFSNVCNEQQVLHEAAYREIQDLELKIIINL